MDSFIAADIVGLIDLLSAVVTAFGRWSSELPAAPWVSASAGSIFGLLEAAASDAGAAARLPVPPPPAKELRGPMEVLISRRGVFSRNAKRLRKVNNWVPEVLTASRRVSSLSDKVPASSAYVPQI